MLICIDDDGSCLEAHAVELVGIDIQFVIGHFSHIQKCGPWNSSVIKGGVGNTKVAEHLLFLGLESDLCVSEDEIVVVVRYDR